MAAVRWMCWGGVEGLAAESFIKKTKGGIPGERRSRRRGRLQTAGQQGQGLRRT